MIKTVENCMSCENITASMNCSLHEINVKMNNVCDEHKVKPSFLGKADCSTCSSFEHLSCPNPRSAKAGMLCFSWNSN
tara:strand:- start:834 stop:1067 length:234 start_codon:yes stop_codon:yes gene_type:complete